MARPGGLLALRGGFGQTRRVQAWSVASGTRAGSSASSSTSLPLVAYLLRVDVVVSGACGARTASGIARRGSVRCRGMARHVCLIEASTMELGQVGVEKVVTASPCHHAQEGERGVEGMHHGLGGVLVLQRSEGGQGRGQSGLWSTKTAVWAQGHLLPATCLT